MQVMIGDTVRARDAEIGKVDGFLFDPRTGKAEHVLVDAGFLQDERALPIECIQAGDERSVFADIGEADFKELSIWNRDAFRARRSDYEGPPSSDLEGANRGDFLMDETVAVGSQGYMSNKPFGFPGGEQLVPDDKQASEVRKGTDVVDADGEKVGDVQAFAIDPFHRTVVLFTIRQGLIFGDEIPLPVDWFDRARPDGVVLKVTKGEVEAHSRAA
jgi:hypothetical protein